VFARGYGTANLEHSVPVTPETVFNIDSISKNILSAVVLQLVDEGKLRLDDDITKYVPEAPTQGHHVTVGQLLNHTMTTPASYLAGMVVERVTKQEYGAYVREHVFKPLGMSAASLCYARTIVPHLASGYELDGGALINAAFMTWKLPFAGGAVCATASDLLKWEAALDTDRVLTPSS